MPSLEARLLNTIIQTIDQECAVMTKITRPLHYDVKLVHCIDFKSQTILSVLGVDSEQ